MPPLVIQGEAVGGPAVTVVLFGWLGSTNRHLLKYAEVYKPKTSGVIVIASASVPDIMLARKKRLLACGLEALSAASVALRSTEGKGKLYVQCFSNGGAFVWECIDSAMNMGDTNEKKKQFLLTEEDKEVLAIVKASLAGQIFDSCPCYLWLSVGFRAIGTAVKSLLPRIVLQAAFVVFAVFQGALRILQNAKTRPEEFWQHWEGGGGGGQGEGSPGPTTTDARSEHLGVKQVKQVKQLYIYSPLDKLCDHVKLEGLIQTRRRQGVQVTAVRLEDSDHVSHLRKRPQDYMAACRSFCGLE